MSIPKLQLNLDIFNLLLNPSGRITGREFLVGISTLFLIALYQILNQTLITTITPVIYRAAADFQTVASLNASPDIFVVPNTYYILIFMSCLILCYKRAVDLNYTMTTGVIFGIIMYFGFSFVFFNAVKLISLNVLEHEIIERANNYMLLYHILNVIVTLTAIALVVYLSTKKGQKDNFVAKTSTPGYLINLGKTTLFFIGFAAVLSLLYVAIKFDEKIVTVLGGVAMLVVLIVYLVLSYKQAKSVRVLFYINLGILIVYFVSLAGSILITELNPGIITLKLYFSLLSILNLLFLLSNLSLITLEPSVKTVSNNMAS